MNENNSTDQTKLLLEKYLRGECTSEEERKVQEWFYSFDEEEPIIEEDRVFALETAKGTIMDHINNDVSSSVPIVRLFSWRKLAIAAAVCVVLGSVIGMYLKKHTMKTPVELAAMISDSTGTYKNDIMPGAFYAYVIYPDGKRKDHVNGKQDLNNSAHAGGNELMTVGVPKAAKYKLELMDGTIVWLNSLSTLSFPKTFAKDERKVELNGEAYFEVAKDVNRPFKISVKGSIIEVLGTSFNVNAYTEEVNTSLVEGKVKIINEGIEEFLIPGEEGVIKGNEIKIAQTDLSKNTAWQRDEFYFDGNNLQDIVGQLARWYDVDFINSELLTGTSTYNGSISRNSKLSTVLNVLAFATQRKFEINGRKVIIE